MKAKIEQLKKSRWYLKGTFVPHQLEPAALLGASVVIGDGSSKAKNVDHIDDSDNHDNLDNRSTRCDVTH